jgi:hypothetical protein
LREGVFQQPQAISLTTRSMHQGTTTGYRRYGAELGLQRNYRQDLGFADQGTQFFGGRCIA